MWHSSHQATTQSPLYRGRWRYVVLLALLSIGLYWTTSPWQLVEHATEHLSKSVAVTHPPPPPPKGDVVVIVTGEEIQHGFGDFVKHIAAAVVIAEIMGAELLSVNGNSYHGYDSARLMDVKMSGRGPAQIAGRVCEATELLLPGVRENLYKTCVAGGEVHAAAVKKALDGCGVIIYNAPIWVNRSHNFRCILPWIRRRMPESTRPDLELLWNSIGTRAVIHFRYGDLSTQPNWDGGTRSLRVAEVNTFLEGVQRKHPTDVTSIILAENYPNATLTGVNFPHLVLNDTTVQESFWLARRSTHILTSDGGFSQLLRVVADKAESYVPDRLYFMGVQNHHDTVAAVPLTALTKAADRELE